MPIYEYHCKSCGHLFDLRQGFDADTVATCSQCGNTASRRFGSVAVIYKGSGFYTTDYKRKESNGHHGDGSTSKTSEPASAGTSHED